MTYSRLFEQLPLILGFMHNVIASVPSIIIDMLFTIVAFSVVLALVHMVRGVRS